MSYEVGYVSAEVTQCPVSDSYHNDTLSVEQEKYAVTDLDPGLQYCVWVAVKTSAGVGPFSHTLIPCRTKGPFYKLYRTIHYIPLAGYTNSEFTVVFKRPNCTKWIVSHKQGTYRPCIATYMFML